MKRGEQFKRIFALFSRGKTAQQIIDMGFPKQTVYWARKEIEKGQAPTQPESDKPFWVRAYEARGRFHDCGDGRRGIKEVFEVWTDEGIIFQLRCCACDAVLDTKFEPWTPASKELYVRYKVRGFTPFRAGPFERVLVKRP